MARPIKLCEAPGEGDWVAATHEGAFYLVVRREATLYCIDDWCNHAGCLLSEGRVEREQVVCGCHEAAFSLVTGEILSTPAICQGQAAFEVSERQGTVWLLGPREEG